MENETIEELSKSQSRLLEALQGMLDWARRVKVLNPGPEIVNAINAIREARGEYGK